LPGGRSEAFTQAVSRALRGRAGQRLPLGELCAAMAGDFDEEAVRKGLATLEGQNKVYVADDLVIGIF